MMLKLENISMRYGSERVLRDLDIEIERGKTIALLGPSGCGKTTTLRIIAGFQRPTQGQVCIAGIDQSGFRPYERNIGVVFQDYSLFPHLTVAENVAFGPKCRGWAKDDIREAVEAKLAMVQLSDLRDRLPRTLSGGQQQRVALARALAINPQILLLDEPLSALDASLRQQLRHELRDLLSAIDTTTIIVTHDQEEAFGLADTIFLMKDGRIVQQGEAETLYNSPANEFAANFIGRGSALRGEVVTEKGKRSFRTDAGTLVNLNGLEVEDGRRILFMRPESMALCEPGAAPDKSRIQISGNLVNVFNMGPKAEIKIKTQGNEEIVADVDPSLGRGLRVGVPAQLSIDKSKLVFLSPEQI